jgi:multidrug efflux system outer membrane protein
MTDQKHFRLAAPAALLAALMLAGCMSMAPNYERPAAPVAGAFPDANSGSAPAQKTAADTDWQTYFPDPQLRRLIDLSLKNNRDLRVAVLNIEQLRAQYRIQRADLVPTISAGVAGNRQYTPVLDQHVYTAGLQVTAWELDLFGRIRSLSDSALAQFLGSQEARKAAQISLVASVADTYYSLIAQDASLEVTRQTLATREDGYRLTKLKFDNGATSELDFRQSESLLEGARVQLAASKRSRAELANALTLLIGQPLPSDALPLPPANGLVAPPLLAELPVGLPSEVLVQRPDVRQAEQNLIATNANIGAARAAFFPRISLTGSAGIASSSLDGLFNGDAGKAWTFAPSITVPIFEGGRNLANLDATKVRRDIAVAQYEKSIQTAFREVADALAGRATLGEQVRAQDAQVKALQSWFNLSDLRYRNGASSYLDVLDAQRSLFVAQLALVQVQAAQVQNQIALYKALGGGWTEAPATP